MSDGVWRSHTASRYRRYRVLSPTTLATKGRAAPRDDESRTVASSHPMQLAAVGTSVQRIPVRLILNLEDPGEVCSPGSSAFWWGRSAAGAPASEDRPSHDCAPESVRRRLICRIGRLGAGPTAAHVHRGDGTTVVPVSQPSPVRVACPTRSPTTSVRASTVMGPGSSGPDRTGPVRRPALTPPSRAPGPSCAPSVSRRSPPSARRRDRPRAPPTRPGTCSRSPAGPRSAVPAAGRCPP